MSGRKGYETVIPAPYPPQFQGKKGTKKMAATGQATKSGGEDVDEATDPKPSARKGRKRKRAVAEPERKGDSPGPGQPGQDSNGGPMPGPGNGELAVSERAPQDVNGPVGGSTPLPEKDIRVSELRMVPAVPPVIDPALLALSIPVIASGTSTSPAPGHPCGFNVDSRGVHFPIHGPASGFDPYPPSIEEPGDPVPVLPPMVPPLKIRIHVKPKPVPIGPDDLDTNTELGVGRRKRQREEPEAGGSQVPGGDGPGPAKLMRTDDHVNYNERDRRSTRIPVPIVRDDYVAGPVGIRRRAK